MDSRSCRRDRVALPFCRVTLKAARPPKIPQNPQTWGEHIKKRRLELDLYQAQVASILGVDESTVTNWEKNKTNPTLRCIPEIVEFLGYAPETESETTKGQKMVQYRKLRGINQETMARQLGIDPATLGRWERDESKPVGKLLRKVESFLKNL